MNRLSALDSLAHSRIFAVLSCRGIVFRRLDIAMIKFFSAMLHLLPNASNPHNFIINRNSV